MLAQSHARKPAPPLAARGMWLRLHGGPDAFGSALGDAVVGSIVGGDQKKAPQNQEPEYQSKPLTQTDIDGFLSGLDEVPGAIRDSKGMTFSENAKYRGALRTQGIDPDAPATDTSVTQGIQGKYVKVKSGDTVSGLMGSSSPRAVGAFLAGNDMTNSNLRVGQLVFVPEDINAFGNQGRAGQATLNADNRRLALVTEASMATAQNANVSAMGPTVERAKAQGIYSGDVGGGAPVSNAAVIALRRSPGRDMTEWNGDSGISAQQMATIRGSRHHQQAANLSEALADVAIGEGAGMVLRATGRAASATARTFGPTLDNMAFNAMDRMGLVMRVVPGGPGAAGGMGSSGAFNAAKRDLGIPRVQQPDAVTLVPMTDSSGQRILNASRQPIMTREYTYTRADGSRVVVQNHSAGHQFGQGGVGDQGAHFNVRPIENTRTGKVPGTLDHYPF